MPKSWRELKEMPLSLGMALAVLAGAASVSVATISFLDWLESVRTDIVESVIEEVEDCNCEGDQDG